jgi:microsomal dipeptidase-like Zn-dependent dipeptidase
MKKFFWLVGILAVVVIGATFSAPSIVEGRYIVRAILYTARTVGVEHVALGSDFTVPQPRHSTQREFR